MPLFSASFSALAVLGLPLYFLFPKKYRWAVLLGLSLVFYLWGGLWMGACLLAVIAITYGAGLLLGRWNDSLQGLSREEKAEKAPGVKRKKKLAAAAAMLLCFGLLFFLKYWDMLAQGVQRRLGLGLPALGLLAPLGVSYYMFQSVGYVVDVYRGKYPPERHPLKYALFVSFFPQITQGPIGRYDALAPQLFEGNDFSWENLQRGLQLILWGCLKKLVAADRAGVVVSAVYGDYNAYGGTMIVVGVLFYCIQLYCDFSGGIDVIRGVARLYGVDMAENFRRPIFAVSLTDFWRRWHISLGTWMKDYLFYPLSLSKPFLKLGKLCRKRIGGRVGKILPTSAATFVIYFVIGIWHGASFKYVAFGLYNGILITAGLLLEPLFSDWREKHGITDGTRWFQVFRMARTFLLVFVGRYITRAGSFSAALAMLWKTVRHPIPSQLWDGTLLGLGLTPWDFLIVGISVAVLLTVELLLERGRSSEDLSRKLPFPVQWLLLTAGLFVLLFFGVFRGDYIPADLIYQQY